MRIFIVYQRIFNNSPDVKILCATTDKGLAKKVYDKRKKTIKKDFDEENDDWGEVCITSQSLPGTFKKGDTVEVNIITTWFEYVKTEVKLFPDKKSSLEYISERKKADLKKYESLVPFDEDETFEESFHLCDEDIAVDIYYSSETVKLK